MLLVRTCEYGIDDYENFSQTEYIFGGTNIKREYGKDLIVSAHIKGTSGTVEIFWLSGSDEPMMLPFYYIHNLAMSFAFTQLLVLILSI